MAARAPWLSPRAHARRHRPHLSRRPAADAGRGATRRRPQRRVCRRTARCRTRHLGDLPARPTGRRQRSRRRRGAAAGVLPDLSATSDPGDVGRPRRRVVDARTRPRTAPGAHAFAARMAASLAIATRPNLAPLGLAIALATVLAESGERRDASSPAFRSTWIGQVRRLGALAAGALPGLVLIGVVPVAPLWLATAVRLRRQRRPLRVEQHSAERPSLHRVAARRADGNAAPRAGRFRVSSACRAAVTPHPNRATRRFLREPMAALAPRCARHRVLPALTPCSRTGGTSASCCRHSPQCSC